VENISSDQVKTTYSTATSSIPAGDTTPNILVNSPTDSYGTNPNTQGLGPLDSRSQIAEVINRSNSDSSGLTINIESPIGEISPIDSAIVGSRSPTDIGMPGGFPLSPSMLGEGGEESSLSASSEIKFQSSTDSDISSNAQRALIRYSLGEEHRTLPEFRPTNLPLPDSGPSTNISTTLSASATDEPIVFTKGRFAPLTLNVTEPFSDTPISTPESSN
jgi:hypothetical protein